MPSLPEIMCRQFRLAVAGEDSLLVALHAQETLAEKCEAMRNFANKIWNASRFVMMNLTIDKCELPAADALAPEDKWVLSKLNTITTCAICPIPHR